ncbi:Thiaminase II [Lachnospiraceae bacterium TWA4]|nr:Thiaminase II [Lachnospiraceae bacterium TWA4]
MKNSQRIYNKFESLWKKYNEHPFVMGLADGSLPKEKFKFFMIQDHLYLMQYAKVFALGVLKSKDEADMRLFASLITATLDVENAIHKSYLKKLGLSNEELARSKPSIVTDSYTNYMIAVAQKEGIAEIMAAVLACSWTYKLIGDFLETYPGAKEQEFYGGWVRQYMGKEYRQANDLMIEMFDRFSEGYSEEQLQNLEHIIYACTQYEYMFWDMAWNEKMIEKM